MLSKVKFKNLHKFNNFILVIKGFTLIFLLVPLLAQSASGKKYYYYAVVGESGGWNFSNSSTKTEYNQFKNDFSQASEENSSGKGAFYVKNKSANFIGGYISSDMHSYDLDRSNFIRVDMTKFYLSGLVFLFFEGTGPFFEISGGAIHSNFDKEVNGSKRAIHNKYGFGVSTALGFNIDLFRWFGLNFQAGYHYTQGTFLGRSTSYDYAGGIALSF